jgi:hypothetical protein
VKQANTPIVAITAWIMTVLMALLVVYAIVTRSQRTLRPSIPG